MSYLHNPKNAIDDPSIPLNQRGTVAFQKNGWTIRRVVMSHAYAKNGNLHNPTPVLRFIIFDQTGVNRGSDPKLREAKSLLTDLQEEFAA